MKKKTLALLLIAVLLIGGAAGGTIAYLTDKTEKVVNTFTVGNVDITLEETTTDFKMVPGTEIAKDPKVTVLKGSVACYLFVKVEKSDNLDQFISYTIDSDWTAGTKTATEEGNGIPVGVYYREQAAIASDGNDAVYSVLTNDKVKCLDTVTKAMMDALTEATYPTLTFTAYACQKDAVKDVVEAWGIVSQPAT